MDSNTNHVSPGTLVQPDLDLEEALPAQAEEHSQPAMHSLQDLLQKNMKELKALCESHDLQSTGRKAVLVHRILVAQGDNSETINSIKEKLQESGKYTRVKGKLVPKKLAPYYRKFKWVPDSSKYDDMEFGKMGDIPIAVLTFLRTYAKRLIADQEKSPLETFRLTLTRCLNFMNDHLRCGFTEQELQEYFDLMFSLKCSVAGRFLWQAGGPLTTNGDNAFLFNCCFRKINEPVKAFSWLMAALYNGSGVGYRIFPEDVAEFPNVKPVKLIHESDAKDSPWIVPDSREGWRKTVERILKHHFYKGGEFRYSTVCLRGKGEILKRTGGKSSGPGALIETVEKINELCNRAAKKNPPRLSPTDCADIVTIIAEGTVVGGCRRSSAIGLGKAYDTEWLNAKNWSSGLIPNHRAYSNNSVIVGNDEIEDLLKNDKFWEGYQGNGEPYGLVNVDNCKTFGRIGDIRYPDPEVTGVNPCAEATLAHLEVCNLSEIFVPNVTSIDELKRCLYFNSVVSKCIYNLTYKNSPETDQIIKRNRRVGLGITGLQMLSPEQRSWFNDDLYDWLRDTDAKIAERMQLPRACKLTVIKPSGTLSLLGGVTSGVHGAYDRQIIRRIRVSSKHDLLPRLRDAGFHVEYTIGFDGNPNHDICVVEFPLKYPDHAKLAKDMSAIDQLEEILFWNKTYVDQAVSCTVTYRKEELPEIKEWLRKNWRYMKTVSFLLYADHGFAQAPLEPITEEKYSEMIAKIKKLNVDGICGMQEDENLLAENMCIGDKCPLR